MIVCTQSKRQSSRSWRSSNIC